MQKKTEEKKYKIPFEKIETRSHHEIFILILGSSKRIFKVSTFCGERKKRKRVERRCSRSSFNRSRIPNEIKIPRRTFEGYKPGRNPKSDSARSGVRSYTRGTTADSSENDLENESKKGEERKEENKIRETLQFEIVIPD